MKSTCSRLSVKIFGVLLFSVIVHTRYLVGFHRRESVDTGSMPAQGNTTDQHVDVNCICTKHDSSPRSRFLRARHL